MSYKNITHSFLASCENIVLWRGHFNATGNEKSVNLSINGGEGESNIRLDGQLFYLAICTL